MGARFELNELGVYKSMQVTVAASEWRRQRQLRERSGVDRLEEVHTT